MMTTAKSILINSAVVKNSPCNNKHSGQSGGGQSFVVVVGLKAAVAKIDFAVNKQQKSKEYLNRHHTRLPPSPFAQLLKCT